MIRLDGQPANRKFTDLLGMRFGMLTVVASCPRKLGERRAWLCRCDCGVEKPVAACNLTSNRTNSCGCVKEEISRINIKAAHVKAVKPGSAFRRLLSQYKHGAKARGLSWGLTEEQFRELTSSPCHYTGEKPYSRMMAQSGEVYVYNGIDRIDNGVGYEAENCVPCCAVINMMKKDLPEKVFLGMCVKVAERSSKCQAQPSI